MFHGTPSPDGFVQTFEFEGAPGHVSLDKLVLEDRRRPDGRRHPLGLPVGRGPRRDGQLRHGERHERRASPGSTRCSRPSARRSDRWTEARGRRAPVSDVDRAKDFYSEQMGFIVDVDHEMGDSRVVQMTPPGSAARSRSARACPMEPGSLKGLQLWVADIEAAHAELVARVAYSPSAPRRDRLGRRQGRRWNSFIFFNDPDGNCWAVQESPRCAPSSRHPRPPPRSTSLATPAPARPASRSPSRGIRVPSGEQGSLQRVDVEGTLRSFGYRRDELRTSAAALVVAIVLITVAGSLAPTTIQRTDVVGQAEPIGGHRGDSSASSRSSSAPSSSATSSPRASSSIAGSGRSGRASRGLPFEPELAGIRRHGRRAVREEPPPEQHDARGDECRPVRARTGGRSTRGPIGQIQRCWMTRAAMT